MQDSKKLTLQDLEVVSKTTRDLAVLDDPDLALNADPERRNDQEKLTDLRVRHAKILAERHQLPSIPTLVSSDPSKDCVQEHLLQA